MHSGYKQPLGDPHAEQVDATKESLAPIHHSATKENMSPPIKPPAAKRPRKGSKGVYIPSAHMFTSYVALTPHA
jgi:hypothetical protein